MVVLDPGEVPDQPGDGVRPVIGTPGELVDPEPRDDLEHVVTDAAEGVAEKFPDVHGTTVPRPGDLLPSEAMYDVQ